jgi:hypothetical protein
MRIRTRRPLRTAFAAALFVLVPAGAAQAAPPNPSWTCSAHAVTAGAGSGAAPTLDPLHANTDPNAACKDAGAAVPALSATDVAGANTLSFGSGSAQAQTGLNNAGGPVYSQAPASVGQIDNSDVTQGANSVHVTAKGLRSYVAGQCQGTTAAFASEGQVNDLRINGTPVPGSGQPNQPVDQILTGVSPLAPVIRVRLNQEYRNGDANSLDQTLTREAVRVELLTAPGAAPFSTIVMGSATAGRHGDVCAGKPAGSPTTSPPTFPPGSNEPGSNGGDVFLNGPGSGSSGPNGGQSGPGGPGDSTASRSGVLGSEVNGVNGGECARMSVFWDVSRRRHGVPASNGPKALRGRYGVRHVLRGVVRNCNGKGVVFGKIDVYNVVRGKRALIKTGLRTRDGGKFTMITPLNYTSRSVEFTYRGLINQPKVASRQALKITVSGRKGRKV